MKTYVSTRPIGGKMGTAGMANIIIPADIDVADYIQKCYRTNTISIALESGGIIDNVSIIKSALNEISFPKERVLLGSQVLWVNNPKKNNPIVIGIINNNGEFIDLSKDKSVLRRTANGFTNEIIVDSEKGVIILNSNSTNESGGDIHIIATNRDKNAKLNVNIIGSINIKSNSFEILNKDKISFTIKDLDIDNNVTEISYEKAIGLTYKDEFGNKGYINSGNIQFKPNSKFNIGDGSEPLILGQTFKDIFEQLSDLISKMAGNIAKMQVNTSMGPSTTPINFQDFTQISLDVNQLKEQYKDFLSKISNTD